MELRTPRELEASSACSPLGNPAWCSDLVARFPFVPAVWEACTRESDPDLVKDCLVVGAGASFSLGALELCSTVEGGRDRVDCLTEVADRELEAPQLQTCAAQDSGKVAGCLRRAHDFTFHPDELHRVVRGLGATSSEGDARARIGELEGALASVFDLEPEAWPADYVFNFAGGATTHIRAMYCAFDEYLLIVGAPIAVNGYSGRYPAEVHDFVFNGRMYDFEETDFEPHELEPGSWAFLPHGGHRVYATEPQTYMLEYARGFVPGMLGFGIRHPRRSITQDRKNMKQQIRMCASRAIETSRRKRRELAEQKRERKRTRRAVRRHLRSSH